MLLCLKFLIDYPLNLEYKACITLAHRVWPISLIPPHKTLLKWISASIPHFCTNRLSCLGAFISDLVLFILSPHSLKYNLNVIIKENLACLPYANISTSPSQVPDCSFYNKIPIITMISSCLILLSCFRQ